MIFCLRNVKYNVRLWTVTFKPIQAYIWIFQPINFYNNKKTHGLFILNSLLIKIIYMFSIFKFSPTDITTVTTLHNVYSSWTVQDREDISKISLRDRAVFFFRFVTFFNGMSGFVLNQGRLVFKTRQLCEFKTFYRRILTIVHMHVSLQRY